VKSGLETRRTSAFKLVFITVAIFLATFTLIIVLLAVIFPGSSTSRDAFELFSTLLKLGFGAIVGLIGGHAFPKEADREASNRE